MEGSRVGSPLCPSLTAMSAECSLFCICEGVTASNCRVFECFGVTPRFRRINWSGEAGVR